MERPIRISVIGSYPDMRRKVIQILSDSLRELGYSTSLGSPSQQVSAADLIFLDNDLSEGLLKIEIAARSPRAQVDQTVFALIGSQKFRLGKPEFHSHEMDALTEFLIEQFLKTHLLE